MSEQPWKTWYYTITVSVRDVLWHEPVTSSDLYRRLPCTVCHHAIGDRRWAMAWGRIDNAPEQGVRLCEDCATAADHGDQP